MLSCPHGRGATCGKMTDSTRPKSRKKGEEGIKIQNRRGTTDGLKKSSLGGRGCDGGKTIRAAFRSKRGSEKGCGRKRKSKQIGQEWEKKGLYGIRKVYDCDLNELWIVNRVR